MCAARDSLEIQDTKMKQKVAIFATTVRHVSKIGKKLVKQWYLLHMSPQYCEHRPTNGWDWFRSLGHPNKFHRVSHLGFVTAATSLTGGQPNFAQCLAVSCAEHCICIFLGILPPDVKCKIHFASMSCVLLYWQRYCMALKLVQCSGRQPNCTMLQGIESQNFRRGHRPYLAGRPYLAVNQDQLILRLVISISVSKLLAPCGPRGRK